jgi:hypothetical protein
MRIGSAEMLTTLRHSLRGLNETRRPFRLADGAEYCIQNPTTLPPKPSFELERPELEASHSRFEAGGHANRETAGYALGDVLLVGVCALRSV